MKSWFQKVFASAAPAAPVSRSAAEERRQGNAYLDQDNLQAAIGCYQRAAILEPGSADAHISLGFALQQAMQPHAALAALTQARQLQPQNFDAAYLCGQVCFSVKQFAQAVGHFEQALALQPGFEPLYGELCQALFEAGTMERARSIIDQGMQLSPHNASFHLFSGNLHFHQRDWDAAQHAYSQALSLDSDLPQVHGNLATILQNQESWQEAITSFDRALGLAPGEAKFHVGRATCLFKLGNLEAAIPSFLKALAVQPDAADAHQFLGAIYLQLDRHVESETHSRKALEANPQDANAHNSLGVLQLSLGKFPQAEKSFRTACNLQPRSAAMQSNLGSSLLRQGELASAIQCFRQAMELGPLNVESGSNLLFALSADPLTLPATYAHEARTFGRNLCSSAGEPFSKWRVERNVDSPLKVGFISGHMRNGSIGNFLEAVLAHVNPARVELVAYSTAPKTDELSERIRPRFVKWNTVFGLINSDIARKIYTDGIHVLIDLNGHTDGNSLPVFALTPAPLQVSWLGYWASTGLQSMDFVLADSACVPPADQNQFTEQVHYMPETRHCFTPPQVELPVHPTPALQQRFVTFGSYQSLTKIHAGVLSTWGRVLQAVPESRLHLTSHQVSDETFQQRFRTQLEAAGIDPSRVTLAGPLPREQYLASYAKVDMILDTFPYTGGTTTCEAMWMGVPTLTLRGNSMIGRQGASMLSCVGLQDWIAESEDDYVVKACAHAANIEKLNTLRLSLRDRALASPLFDAPRFAKDWEDAVLAMWKIKHG